MLSFVLFYFCYVVWFEIRDAKTSSFSFVIPDYFSYPGISCFHEELKILLSCPVEDYVGILIGIILNLQSAFNRVINPADLWADETNFLISSSIYFFNILKVLLYKSFTCFVKVTPNYFHCDCDIVSLFLFVCFLVYFSFVYKKTTDILRVNFESCYIAESIYWLKEFSVVFKVICVYNHAIYQ